MTQFNPKADRAVRGALSLPAVNSGASRAILMTGNFTRIAYHAAPAGAVSGSALSGHLAGRSAQTLLRQGAETGRGGWIGNFLGHGGDDRVEVGALAEVIGANQAGDGADEFLEGLFQH